jgi:hypothetical protein
MPTGYTSGILDGKINTFEEFAIICTRNFGAAMHMKENSIFSEYEPRIPDDFYSKNIEEWKEKLVRIKSMTDEEITEDFNSKMEEKLVYLREKLEEETGNLAKLNYILEKAKSWIPPTKDHYSLKKFMIEQLEVTIKNDGDASYTEDRIIKIEELLNDPFDVKYYREKEISTISDNISRYEISYQQELERCKRSNQWMEEFFGSIAFFEPIIQNLDGIK